MTQTMIDELALAIDHNLEKEYLQNNYIYQIDDNGHPSTFLGIEGDLTENTGPCLQCTVHTQEKWEQYKKDNPWVDGPSTSKPDNSEDNDHGNWWDNIWPFGEGEEE
jgi:hypothetical protein